MSLVLDSFDRESGEYSFIDKGITSLDQIPLRRGIISLKLNVNQLTTLDDSLSVCGATLISLDASTNRIRRIDAAFKNLDKLSYLSLSCNRLVSIEGIQHLRSLVTLNLSYNSIIDISNLSSLRNLKVLFLEGNELSSMTNIIGSIRSILCINELCLQQHNASNPVCKNIDYRRRILQGLPRLSLLDGINRQVSHSRSNIMNSSIESNSNSGVGATPSIDSALNHYYRTLSTASSSTQPAHGIDTLEIDADGIDGNEIYTEYEDDHLRLRVDATAAGRGGGDDGNLGGGGAGNGGGCGGGGCGGGDVTEGGNKYNSHRRPKLQRKQKQHTDIEDDSILSDYGTYGNSGIDTSFNSNDASFVKSTISSVNRSEIDVPKKPRKSNSPCRAPRNLNSSPNLIKTSKIPKRRLERSNDSVLAKVTSGETDNRLRNDLQQSLAVMSGQLCEAQQSKENSGQEILRLQEHIRLMSSQHKHEIDDSKRDERGVQRDAEAMLNELSRCHKDLDYYKEENAQLKREMYKDQEEIDKLTSKNKQLQRNMEEINNQHNKNMENCKRKLEDHHIRLRSSQSELELTKSANSSLKSQLVEIEQLVVHNELKQKKAVSEVTSLDNPTIKNLLQNNSEKEREIHERVLQIEKNRYNDLEAKYIALENEFKYALRIEEHRHKELEDDFIAINTQHSKCNQIIAPLKEKNKQFNEMIGELTSLVKEQKVRIQELGKSKQDIMNINRERVSELQLNLNEARNRIINHEILKKEKLSLASEKIAMTSIIEGLKSERKLWSVELAEQGVSLVQDRGRLENKIESLNSEIVTLKKNLFSEVDCVKIKTKVIEDQTETIKKLKKDLITNEEENKKDHKSDKIMIATLQEELKSEKLLSIEIQETSDRIYEKKEILKEELLELQDAHSKSVADYKNLLEKWQSKSSLINTLECKVAGVNKIWQKKFNDLNNELVEAKQNSSESLERLKNADNHFRLKVDEIQCSHQNNLVKLEQKYQNQIKKSKDEVYAVENEMRTILSENEKERKKTELSIKKLMQAFSEINQNLN